MMDGGVPDLSAATARGRWVRLGPYYAMFPVDFVTEVIRRHGTQGRAVVDPFCGRGTVPFVEMAMGLPAVAAEVNPVAWVYTKTKVDPHGSSERVKSRRLQSGECALEGLGSWRGSDPAQNDLERGPSSPCFLGGALPSAFPAAYVSLRGPPLFGTRSRCLVCAHACYLSPILIRRHALS